MNEAAPEIATKDVPVCALGASAGGLAALRDFFMRVPDDLGLAYVIITHLAPDHPSALSEILSGCTSMSVRQVEDGPALTPNCVYVIPPDRELVIEGNCITARPFSQPRGQRAPIDMFFRSVAKARGDGCAIVLSGSGSDGAQGVLAIRAAGGIVFVQEPADAEYAMMPHSAIASGAADFVAPIPRIVARLNEVMRSKAALRSMQGDDVEQGLQRIMSFLQARTGHDFSKYKRATVLRRISRRMQVVRCYSFDAYAEHLTANPEEAQELFSDLLISVTSFFRDPDAYEALASDVIPALFNDAGEEGIRVWVVGCATGEEAYSLAMLMLEEAERRRVSTPIQIFATDLDEGALATAREARYASAIEVDVPDDRLRRHFVREGAHYRIRREVRDLVLFASHSVLKDPPFMRLDLIACRNLLIYLDRDLQREVCTMFAYALKPNRFLFLGSAETTDAAPETFAAIHREHRIYRVPPQARCGQAPVSRFPPQYRTHALPSPRPAASHERDRFIGASHLSALEIAAPPSALVDRAFRLIHLSPNAGRFLLPVAGPFSAELVSLARPELRLDLTTGLRRALERGEATLTPAIGVAFDGTRHRVMLHISAVRDAPDEPPSQALVVFLDGGPMPAAEDATPEEASAEDARRLRAELNLAESRLVTLRAEHEAAMQDLRIANEELQSINEEYRSTAEELETSKEELQSMNEELQTVNAEGKIKLDSISTAHNDLKNLVTSTEVGTLFLDPQLRIRMFTPKVAGIFNVTEADVGRAITDFTHRLSYQALPEDAARVLRDLAPVEREIETRDGRWLLVRVRPYRTVEDRIDGVVVTFIDVSERRAAVASMHASEARFRALVSATSNVIFRMSPDWQEMLELNGGGLLTDTSAPDRDWLGAFVHEKDQKRVAERIREAIATKETFEFEHRVRRLDGSTGWVLSRAVPILDEDGEVLEWFGAATDITERRRNDEARNLLIGELNHRVKNMLAVVQSIAAQTRRSSDNMAQFVDAFEGRIRALAAAHGLLTRSQWSGVGLEELARTTIAALLGADSGRVRISGPEVTLRPDAVTVLAMALHELGTNAVKHGSLSSPQGTLAIGWSLDRKVEGGRVTLDWSERGGPEVPPPKRDGFGARLLRTGVARELDGEVELKFLKDGLQCRLEFPLEQ